MYKIFFLLSAIVAKVYLVDSQNAWQVPGSWRNNSQQQQQCGSQWQGHDKCMQSKQSEYRRTKELSADEQAGIKVKVRACFRNARCSDPFLSDGEIRAKQKCYLKYKTNLTRDMAQCIQKKYPDYSFPLDNDAANMNGQDMVTMKNSGCKPADKKSFGVCLFQARGKYGQSSSGSSKPRDYCAVRYDCYQQSQYTARCYERSARVREELCRCSRNLSISAYKSIYVQCLQNERYPVRDERQDYNLIVLAQMNTSGNAKFCSNTTDPCGGFQGRQTVQRGDKSGQRGSGSSSNRGNWGQGSNQGSGSQGSSQGSGSQGSNQGSGGSQGSNSQGGSTGASSSSSTSSSTNASTTDYGLALSSSANPDFGSLLTGGSFMPDPSSVLSGAGLGTSSSTSVGTSGSVGGLLGQSLGTGGFDVSSIMDNGFDPSTLTSSLGGGLDPSSLISNLGSGFDLSSLLGGGKRK